MIGPLNTEELPVVVKGLALADLYFWRDRLAQTCFHEHRIVVAEIDRRDPQALWEMPLFRGMVE